MNEPSAEKLFLYIDQFESYSKSNKPNPEDFVTYYCDSGDGDEGFVYNIQWKDGGIEKFICKKWILQRKLDLLMNT